VTGRLNNNQTASGSNNMLYANNSEVNNLGRDIGSPLVNIKREFSNCRSFKINIEWATATASIAIPATRMSLFTSSNNRNTNVIEK
jgi:hypothetical protein